MKRFLGFAASILSIGLAATLAGCAGCSGCNGCGSEVKNTTLTNSNWFTSTNYKGIQPSFIAGGEHFSGEKIRYTVTHEKSSSVGQFSVEYTNGSYSTEFFATTYDWNGSIEKYRTEKVETVYCFKTQFKINVQYKNGDKSTETFEDKTIEECYFRAAGKNLQPIYSRQEIISHSPANFQPASLEGAYAAVESKYENFYSYDCNEVTSYIEDNGKKSEKTVDLSKFNKSLFDTSSLVIAVRSMKLSGSFSQTVGLYSPSSGAANYNIAGTDAALSDEEKTGFSNKLQEKGLYNVTTDENGNKSTVPAVAVNVSYMDGELRGTSHTMWFAAVENTDNNTPRATMLKMSLTLGYGAGNLVFSLDGIDETLWNGKN